MRLTPTRMQLLLNLWGPFRGAGIRVDSVSKDWREVTVSMGSRFYNRNIQGTHFGGSLYAMTDPHYLLMLMQLLGREYIVWDKAASIEYLAPAHGTVRAHFEITDEQLSTIRARTAQGDKHLPVFSIDVIDRDNTVVARVSKTVYVRRRTSTQVGSADLTDPLQPSR